MIFCIMTRDASGLSWHNSRLMASFKNIKASETAAQATATKTGVSAGGGIPLVAQGQAIFDRTTTLDEREAAERTYDPLWVNAQTLLDNLESADLIHRDLANARIGEFVLVSGELSMLQMTLLKDRWIGSNFKEKTIDTHVAKAMSKMGAPEGKTAVARQARANALVALELLATLPHSVQATLMGEDVSVWCVLSENSLIPAPSDITLKYGSLVMPGEWHALGILDAMPNPIPPQTRVPVGISQHFG